MLAVIPVIAALAAVVHGSYNVPHAPRDSAPNLGYQKLWELQHNFWDRFMYPNNVKEAQSINSTIFSDDVQGRVSDTRDFEGRELNTEYIFGLFVPVDRTSIIGQPHTYEIVQFVANQNIASASTRVNFTFKSFGNASYPVMVDTWLTWNSDNQLTQYDVTFRWFGNLLDQLLTSIVPGNPTAAKQKAVGAIATAICDSHQAYCNNTIRASNQQYSSHDDCMSFMTTGIRVGQSWELGMDTLLCRSLHMIMLQYRPDVHCPHIGPTGGGMCADDVDYTQKVAETYFHNSPWIPTIIG